MDNTLNSIIDRPSDVNVSFKHYSPSLCSPVVAVADSWENVTDRDIIRLPFLRSCTGCYSCDWLTHRNDLYASGGLPQPREACCTYITLVTLDLMIHVLVMGNQLAAKIHQNQSQDSYLGGGMPLDPLWFSCSLFHTQLLIIPNNLPPPPPPPAKKQT